jgi:hypothetical protein
MHIHVRARRWVFWWFVVGVVCGAVALANIFGRELTRTQERVILLLGIAHWVLGGIVCFAWDAIRLGDSPEPPVASAENAPRTEPREAFYSASDFLVPGARKSLLPPGHRR